MKGEGGHATLRKTFIDDRHGLTLRHNVSAAVNGEYRSVDSFEFQVLFGVGQRFLRRGMQIPYRASSGITAANDQDAIVIANGIENSNLFDPANTTPI